MRVSLVRQIFAAVTPLWNGGNTVKSTLSRGALALTTTCALALALPAAASADVMERTFKGKKVTIVVGFDAGGTYGLYSQLLAQYLAPRIPGKPTIIVQYMPGGGGLKAVNYAFKVMPKTGLNWIMPPDSIVISNLLEPDKARYDARKFTYLGNVVQTNAVVVVRADKGVKTLEDLQKTQVIVGSTGTGSQTFLVPSTLNALFGTKIKIVQGYKGSMNMMQSVEQKEIDGGSLTWGAWSANRPAWFKDGYALPIVQLGMEPDPDLPKVPMLSSYAKSDEDKQIVALISSLGPIGRSLALPPGVDMARAELLRAAFAATVADPAFRENAKKRRLDVNPMSGEALQKVVEDLMKVPPTVVKRARDQIMKRGARAS